MDGFARDLTAPFWTTLLAYSASQVTSASVLAAPAGSFLSSSFPSSSAQGAAASRTPFVPPTAIVPTTSSSASSTGGSSAATSAATELSAATTTSPSAALPSPLEQLTSLIQFLRRPAPHGAADMKALKRAVDGRSCRFTGHGQHDAHEFLMELVNLLEDDMEAREWLSNRPPSRLR